MSKVRKAEAQAQRRAAQKRERSADSAAEQPYPKLPRGSVGEALRLKLLLEQKPLSQQSPTGSIGQEGHVAKDQLVRTSSSSRSSHVIKQQKTMLLLLSQSPTGSIGQGKGLVAKDQLVRRSCSSPVIKQQ